MKKLESNIWKMRVYLFTHRRAYIPLVSIYFLTLPNTTLQQIGLYTWIGTIAGFLLEIPSGYFSDYFGHRKTLILAKGFMLLASLFFIVATWFPYFILGSVCIALGFAFSSGTNVAFFHETLEWLWEDNKFTKIWWRMWWSVSLFNAGLIVALPFLTQISFKLPFQVWLVLDIVWLVIALTFVAPPKEKQSLLENKQKQSIKTRFHDFISIIKTTKNTGFWSIAIFSIIVWLSNWPINTFRDPYLQSLWFPIVYIGFVMWWARVIRFLVSRIVHKIEEKIDIQKLFFIEIFIFSWAFLMMGFVKNRLFIWIVSIILTGYSFGRRSIITHYLIKKIPNKKYKATILSTKQQIASILQFIIIFILGYLMNISYTLWYAFLGWLLFIGLSTSYIFIKKNFK